MVSNLFIIAIISLLMVYTASNNGSSSSSISISSSIYRMSYVCMYVCIYLYNVFIYAEYRTLCTSREGLGIHSPTVM